MCDKTRLVSIIIPAYNVENYIDRCIESILAQTYTNLEVLIVDDGSSDGTWSHIQSFMERDGRVKGFHRANAGVSATRNFAMTQATGYYLEFVDADDFLREDAVAILVDAIESSGASWVNFQFNRVDENNPLLENFKFLKEFKLTDTPEAKFNLIRDDLLSYFIGYEVWNKFYITSIIKENNLNFNENCHIGEDVAFNICYGFHADSINCIEDRLYNYIIRSNSAMENAKSLSINFCEHLALVKGIEPEFNKVFSGEIKDDFYQLFFKLMLNACMGQTAEETYQVAKKLDDEYFKRYLSESLKHKDKFRELFYPGIAKLYYRYGMYIYAHLNGDYIKMLYLKLFDFYRKLRKRETLKEWKLS